MPKEVDYSSLKEQFRELESEITPKRNNYRRDIKEEIGKGIKESRAGHTPSVDAQLLGMLSNIQDYANHGNFRRIIDESELFKYFLVSNSQSLRGADDYDKYLSSMSKRLDRASNTAINYVRTHKDEITKEKLRDIHRLLDYSEGAKKKSHRNVSSSQSLEKAVTAVSLFAMVLGIAIGYPALIGDVIAQHAKTNLNAGALLFVLGLLGVFLANKK